MLGRSRSLGVEISFNGPALIIAELLRPGIKGTF